MKLNPPAFLVVSVTVLVFSTLLLLFFKQVPNAVENVLFTLIGGILAKWGTMIDYHFGSSSGSHRKTDMIQELTGAGDGNGGTVKTNATITTEKVTTVTSEPKQESSKEPTP